MREQLEARSMKADPLSCIRSSEATFQGQVEKPCASCKASCQNNNAKITAPPNAHPIAPPAIVPASVLDERTEGEFDEDDADVDVEANADDADVEVKDVEEVEPTIQEN